MSAVTFGLYDETDDEGDAFEVGSFPVLDGIDGFRDGFQSIHVGDSLAFLIPPGDQFVVARSRAREPEAGFWNQLLA